MWLFKYVLEIEQLYSVISAIKEKPINKRYEKESETVNIIRDFLKSN